MSKRQCMKVSEFCSSGFSLSSEERCWVFDQDSNKSVDYFGSLQTFSQYRFHFFVNLFNQYLQFDGGGFSPFWLNVFKVTLLLLLLCSHVISRQQAVTICLAVFQHGHSFSFPLPN